MVVNPLCTIMTLSFHEGVLLAVLILALPFVVPVCNGEPWGNKDGSRLDNVE